MNISSIIEKVIRDEYKSGATQDALSIKYSIHRPNLNKLLSKKRKFENMALKTFEKMFPKAVIYLFGEKNAPKNKMGDIVDSNANIGNNNNIEANNFLPKEEKNKNDTDLIQQKIKSVMLNTELSPDEKLKFIKILIGE